jgi:hypothetical protein
MDNFASGVSVTMTGLKELRAHGVFSSGSYTAKLLGHSDEEAAVSTFETLVDAIGWLIDALENGALAKQADVYSARGELIWSIPGSPQQQVARNRNEAQRGTYSGPEQQRAEAFAGDSG